MKKWEFLGDKSQKKKAFNKKQIVELLLKNRGLTTKTAREDFLCPPDPYRLTAEDLGISEKELELAVDRLKRAVVNKEKVICYGDYDTDGVCATAILWETLYHLGCQAMPFIPTRDEGYGLKKERLEQFQKEGYSLIVTVDHGITAYEQVEFAKKIGLDLIVTDHHLLGEKKIAPYALVHTTKLCGAGVAWFLANQLKRQNLDLVLIGTIADLMPLVGINRQIVFHGLKEIGQTKRPGLLALFTTARIAIERIRSYEIGYLIGPRLNAAGRLEDPMDALRLLCTKNQQTALDLAKKLDEQNRQRQSLMGVMTDQAKEKWLLDNQKKKIIFVGDQKWEHGLVGLVAGKLVEEFNRPAVVVSQGQDYSRASIRSISGFNIVEILKKTCADLLTAYGGHTMAAGFTVETKNLKEVEKRLTKEAEKIAQSALVPKQKIDLELELTDLSLGLYEGIKKLEPFGLGNPEPVFASYGLVCQDARVIGSSGSHLKLKVKKEGESGYLEGIGFNMSVLIEKLSPDQKINLAYTLSVDEWNQQKKLVLKIKDLKINGTK